MRLQLRSSHFGICHDTFPTPPAWLDWLSHHLGHRKWSKNSSDLARRLLDPCHASLALATWETTQITTPANPLLLSNLKLSGSSNMGPRHINLATWSGCLALAQADIAPKYKKLHRDTCREHKCMVNLFDRTMPESRSGRNVLVSNHWGGFVSKLTQLQVFSLHESHSPASSERLGSEISVSRLRKAPSQS